MLVIIVVLVIVAFIVFWCLVGLGGIAALFGGGIRHRKELGEAGQQVASGWRAGWAQAREKKLAKDSARAQAKADRNQRMADDDAQYGSSRLDNLDKRV